MALFHLVAGAPDPVAPFSHAVEADGWVFVTGQMPFTGTSVDDPYPQGIEAQTRQVFRNLETVLRGIGLDLADVVQARVYLARFERDYAGMNAAYAAHFAAGRRPARTCIGVTALAKGALVEIDFVARRPEREQAVSGAEARADAVEQARRLVDSAERIVVLTGAGISTESGIPDFRGPKGVWTRNPAAEKQSTIQHYLADPEVRKAAWRSRLASPAWSAEPNAGHRALVALERRGSLHALVTQNIDELHQRAGQSPALVVEVHGSMRRVMCWQCGRRAPMEEALARVRAGEADPHCLDCGGILKSDTISFGQALVPEVIDRALSAAAEADLLIAVGTTLQVQPVAGMVPIAARAGARVVIVNDQETAMDSLADVVLRRPIGAALTALCVPLDASG